MIKQASTICLGDADSLIALFLEYDVHSTRSIEILKNLKKKAYTVIYPSTAVAEAITTIARKHSNPQMASYLVQQYKNDAFRIEYIDEDIMKLASEIYNPLGSKQNTFFDALVAATAKKLQTDIIFSFDKWYKKLGFTLASEL